MPKVINKVAGEVELKEPLSQLVSLAQVYRGFDGYSTVIEDDGGKKRSVTEPYRFTTNPRMYLIIAKCQSALAPLVEKFNKAQQGLLNARLPRGESSLDSQKNPKEFGAYIKDLDKLGEGEEVVRLLVIKVKDLDMDHQPFSASMLSQLERRRLLVDGDGDAS